jgi:cysteine desulfurase
MGTPIYLDNHATTPMDPRVLEAMLPYFKEHFGNAASRDHDFGLRARQGVDEARALIAALIGASPREIVFTSGATESDNLALKGVVEAAKNGPGHIITVVTEHKAVLDTAKYLETRGTRVTWLPVDGEGLVTAAQVEAALTPETLLVSVMLGNNEIGVLQPIREIGALCRSRGILFHTDATQGVGKVPVDVNDLNVDLMSLSAHKMYGPKGVGALFVRQTTPRLRLAAQLHGGGHEWNLRSGTLNVPGIVGFGAAARICREELPAEAKRLAALRDRLYHGVVSQLREVHLNGHPTKRLPGNLNLSFAGVEGEAMMLSMPDLAVSSGSACSSANLRPSYVLEALGKRKDLIHTSIRFGLGRFTTEAEIELAITQVVDAATKLRKLSPLWELLEKGVDVNALNWGPEHDHH